MGVVTLDQVKNSMAHRRNYNYNAKYMVEIGNERFIKITWGSLSAAAAGIVSIVIWTSAVDNKASEAAERVERQSTVIKDMQLKLQTIDSRTVRIETILERLVEDMQRHNR